MSVNNPPALFLAVVAAVLAAWLLVRLEASRRKNAFTYSSLPFLLDAARISLWPGRVLAGAFALAVLLGGVALAGVRLTLPVPAKDGAIVLCLDTSGSMRASDITPSREAAVRAAARLFVQNAPAGTRVALIAFSTGAEQISELSDDKQVVLQALENVPPANGATAIGDALALAGRILPPRGRRVIVLVTDGVNNRGVDPLQTAQALGAQGVGIYTVGIGTNGSGLTIPGTNEEATIDEDALRAIAAAGHGTYTRTADAAALSGAFSELARATIWERRRVDVSLPLALASAVAIALTFLGALVAGRFP